MVLFSNLKFVSKINYNIIKNLNYKLKNTKIKTNHNSYYFKNKENNWGLGIGDWGLGPIPNPQSPIPNPHFDYLI
jgi:hypothetical protein